MSNKNKINLLVTNLARKKIKTRDDFLILLRGLSKKHQLAMPSHSVLLAFYKELRLNKKIKKNIFFETQLKKRPIRSLSGVAVISVLTKPYPCPGHCLYCPTDKNFPKSYLPGEPAAERARFLKYDPYKQVKYRLKTLQKIGHSTDKVELIIIGASWTAYPEKYKKWFVKRCFEGANNANSKFKSQISKPKLKTKKYIKFKDLYKAQKNNETAANRIISISVETRPDLIRPEEIVKMRQLGITKIELGIQALDNKILEKNKRGHGLKEIIEATKLLKDAGFKICYHIMPGLYGSNPKKDLLMFKKLFADQNFQPDYLKIYPCVVTKGSGLYKLWRKGKYKPYTNKTLIDLLIKMKKIVPAYVRIIRVFRDIPSNKIETGSKISNLREVVQKEMIKRKLKCQCIRCREIKNTEFKIKNIKLIKRKYRASDGKEIFLSFEDKKNDKILAFLRLRLLANYPLKADQPLAGKSFTNIQIKNLPVLKNATVIRELHTYGEIVRIGQKKKSASQHKNLGRKLVEEAEKISKKYEYKKMAVISGIGARPYWKKLSYKLQDTYMIKKI